MVGVHISQNKISTVCRKQTIMWHLKSEPYAWGGGKHLKACVRANIFLRASLSNVITFLIKSLPHSRWTRITRSNWI